VPAGAEPLALGDDVLGGGVAAEPYALPLGEGVAPTDPLAEGEVPDVPTCPCADAPGEVPTEAPALVPEVPAWPVALGAPEPVVPVFALAPVWSGGVLLCVPACGLDSAVVALWSGPWVVP
jgi:hypothetical protein